MTLALLCAVTQEAWAQAVNYIYYTVDNETQVATKHTDGLQETYTVLDANKYQLESGWYVVNSSFTYSYKLQINANADVKIILCDNTTLTAPRGIRVNTSATLTIYAQSEGSIMGKLIARNDGIQDWAAIGGEKNDQAGIIRIHGGHIEAKSTNKNGAGIGGGGDGENGGMKEITIYNGKITAEGADNGAGIGAAKNNKKGTINIYGGEITAKGGKYGAGIGGAQNRGGWDTNICGGTITATGGDFAAGIGGGYDGDGGNLTFRGGTVTATGGESAAGIGGGNRRSGGNINIYDGTVIANGGYDGAGIGGGAAYEGAFYHVSGGAGGNITIYGGTVRAHGGVDGACIGGGYVGKSGTITIKGGSVTATFVREGETEPCRGEGAAIGGGRQGIVETITIEGGNVNATNTYDVSRSNFWQGAAIGAGGFSGNYFCQTNGTINISGGNIVAESIGTGGVGGCIGGGEKTKDAKVNITGGHVTLKTRNIAIGAYNDKDGTKLTLGSYMCVEKSIDNYVNASQRVSTCTAFEKTVDLRIIRIFPCSHNVRTYTVSSDSHTGHCKHCAKDFLPESHNIETVGGTCDKCGYDSNENIVTLGIFTPDGSNCYQGVGYPVVKGQNFILPDCDTKVSGMTFKGWLIGGDVPSNIEAADGEDLKAPGFEYTATTNISIYARYKALHITLNNNDTEDSNWTAINQYDGLTATDVTLSGRAFYKNGSWNTLTLPFNHTVNEGSPLSGATVMFLNNASFERSTGTLTLDFKTAGSEIQAGRPYIIKWENDTEHPTIDSPVFNNVEISNVTRYSEFDCLTFAGNYGTLGLEADSYNILYLGSGNKLYYPNTAMTIDAFRAFFQLTGIEDGETADARHFVLNFDGETTAIPATKFVEDSLTKGSYITDKQGVWYDMQGRKISGKPLLRGLYINNGVKVVIK